MKSSFLSTAFDLESLDFLKKRFTRLPTMDERSRVKMTNNLLEDFENVYKKNNLPLELLYEIIRSLKYWGYYREAGISFSTIETLGISLLTIAFRIRFPLSNIQR